MADIDGQAAIWLYVKPSLGTSALPWRRCRDRGDRASGTSGSYDLVQQVLGRWQG